MMSLKKFSWEFDEEAEVWRNSTHDTIEDCIAAAREENKLDGNLYNTVYIGQNTEFVPCVDAERVLEQIEEDAAEFCGEVGGDWEAYSLKKRHELDELDETLSVAVREWLKKYGYEPSFYRVEDIEEHSLKGPDHV